jgi:hypothetical protein
MYFNHSVRWLIKWLIMAILLVTAGGARAQLFKDTDYRRIDDAVAKVEASTLDSLAHELTFPYSEESQKVRAIYSWIAQHIRYNTGMLKGSRPVYFPAEDSTDWTSAVEMTARRVLKRRAAVCDGYAKLFKTLCDKAGIRSELVTGYARGYADRDRFRTNHSWNAVQIDSVWHLLDVTWGSGYVNQNSQFVFSMDDRWYLSPPSGFIRDHYPEDLRWALLDQVPSISEFQKSPFRFRSFVKYGITGYFPGKGQLQAFEGDNLELIVEVKDLARDSTIGPDPFFDPETKDTSAGSVYLEPVIRDKKIYYQYRAEKEGVQWLHLMYNGDLILRYRLSVHGKPKESLLQTQLGFVPGNH